MNIGTDLSKILLIDRRMQLCESVNDVATQLAMDLFEQEVYLNRSLKMAALIKRQLKHLEQLEKIRQLKNLPPLAINQKGIRFRKEMLVEVEAEVFEHARCRSQLADAIYKNSVYMKLAVCIERQQEAERQRKRWWQIAMEMVTVVVGEIAIVPSLIGQAIEANRFKK